MNITWKYASPVSEEQINKVERTYGIKVPTYLKNVIKDGNNGYPSKNKFDAKNSHDHLFKTLLSYNEQEMENVFTAFAALKEANATKMIPFGNDPAGNLICMKDNKVILWNHETGNMEDVCDSVVEFFDHLH